MAAEIARLGGAGKRPWTGVGAEGNGVINDISVLVPAAGVVSSHADHAGKRGGKDVHSSGWGRSHEQGAGGGGLGDNLAQPFAMIGVRSPEAQVNEVHALLQRPAEGGFEGGNGSGEAVRKNLDGVELDLRGLGTQDSGESSAVAYAVGVVAVLLNDAGFAQR